MQVDRAESEARDRCQYHGIAPEIAKLRAVVEQPDTKRKVDQRRHNEQQDRERKNVRAKGKYRQRHT